MRRRPNARFAFTLVELLTTIALAALLVAIIVPMVGNYVSTAREVADQQSLEVLNDAINRYKMGGGSLAALTAGKPLDRLITELQTPVSWNGVSHQFLQNSFARRSGATIAAVGSGSTYRLTQYGSYTGEAGGSEVNEFEPFNQTGLLVWHDFNNATASFGSPNLVAQNSATFTGGYGVCQTTGSRYFTLADVAGYPTGSNQIDCSWVIRFRLHSGTPFYTPILVRAYRDALRYNPNPDSKTLTATAAGWYYPGIESSPVSLETWYTAVCTYDVDTGTQTFYLNGSLVGTSNDSNSGSTGSWSFGELEGTFATADISHFSAWSRTLTAAEALRLHNSGADITYADL